MRDEQTTRTLRLSKDLSDWLEEYAQQNQRSINAQIVYMLEQERRRVERERKADPLQ